jgi:uncharacterized protein YqhQ
MASLGNYQLIEWKGQISLEKRFIYGGQAVIEGVMIRGQSHYSLAVRKPNGEITTEHSKLNSFYTGKLKNIPLARGMVVLIETMLIGIKALSRSANISLEEEDQEISGWSMAVMLLLSISFGVSLFFIAPLLAIRSLDTYISSDALSNFAEGVLRLTIFLVYIFLIGRFKDIKRVFEYHGAEHMTIHAYEHGLELETDNIRQFPTAHNRCGTAFLLVVMMIAIVVFTFIGRPSIPVSIVSRIVLVPVIAGISYEIIKLSGFHSNNLFVKLLAYPSLALQSLTTRQPDDLQIEVAIAAMNTAIDVDKKNQKPVKS